MDEFNLIMPLLSTLIGVYLGFLLSRKAIEKNEAQKFFIDILEFIEAFENFHAMFTAWARMYKTAFEKMGATEDIDPDALNNKDVIRLNEIALTVDRSFLKLINTFENLKAIQFKALSSINPQLEGKLRGSFNVFSVCKDKATKRTTVEYIIVPELPNMCPEMQELQREILRELKSLPKKQIIKAINKVIS